MSLVHKSYIISCTPRSGSHLLADGLAAAGVAGYPTERFPPPLLYNALTPEQRDALVTEAPPESSYNPEQDAEYIRKVIDVGTTPNGVFGTTIHWFQVNDAVRRLQAYLNSRDPSIASVFASAFPNLSYIWLRRRDKVAQAVSWYKAIQTGRYVKIRGTPDADRNDAEETAFDYQRIRAYWSALRSSENGWGFYFKENNLEPLTIYYEELSEGYEITIRKVLRYLGLDPLEVNIGKSRYEKSANAQSVEWAARFKAIQSASKTSA